MCFCNLGRNSQRKCKIKEGFIAQTGLKEIPYLICHHRELVFKFKDDFEGRIYLQDKRQDTTRLLLDNSIRQTGDRMKLDGVKWFYITISQTRFDEDIVDNDCKSYPTPEFRNYEECDIRYMRCIGVFTAYILQNIGNVTLITTTTFRKANAVAWKNFY